MATTPKETSLIVRDLERDLHEEERILKDLERDIRRDADVLKQLEWDVAELGRAVPASPARRRSKGTTIAFAVVSGVVLLAAGFGIGMAVQNVTTSNVRDDLAAAEAAQRAAAQQVVTTAAGVDAMLAAKAPSDLNQHLATSSAAFDPVWAEAPTAMEQQLATGSAAFNPEPNPDKVVGNYFLLYDNFVSQGYSPQAAALATENILMGG